MSARVLDGRALARRLNQALKQTATRLPRPPGLAVVLVGEDPASQVYVKRKGVVAERIGFHHRQIDLPASTSMDTILGVIDELNADAAIDGILLQLPLPGGLDGRIGTERIQPEKDVDGLTIGSAGLIMQGRPHMVPCTPKGCMALIAEAGVEIEGATACVLGRSNLVGRPVAHLLEQANATVTQCHSRTRNVAEVVGRSDIVVAAIGKANFVKGEWIKPGAVVIDVGINRMPDGSLIGDVAYEAAAERAGAITPVPGGVGPLTVAMLMDNTYRASARAQGIAAD